MAKKAYLIVAVDREDANRQKPERLAGSLPRAESIKRMIAGSYQNKHPGKFSIEIRIMEIE